MALSPPTADSCSPIAATLSALIPGTGQVYRRRPRHALQILVLMAALLACTVLLGRTQDRATEIFFFLLVVLPVWVVQSYDAYLPHGPRASGLRHTLTIAWQRAHDIRYLGALFLVSAFMDAYIIVANPTYALPFFCTKPEGALGVLAKAQSPTLHTLIGYGFLRLRRWSLLLYLLYAGFGLLNATVNYACFGFGRIRTTLVVTLVLFTAYLWWRRRGFTSDGSSSSRLPRGADHQASLRT